MFNRKRRELLNALLGMSSIHLVEATAADQPITALDEPKRSQVTVDAWFSELMNESAVYKDFGSALDLRRFKDPTYVVLADLPWKPVKATAQLQPVTVPRGFVTDLASVPSPFWSIFRPDGDYAYAAILHDYLYWIQDRKRGDADAVFLSVMTELKINDFHAEILYLAVNKLGGLAWEKNQQLKASGEIRILSKLPDRSDITWAEWRKRNKLG